MRRVLMPHGITNVQFTLLTASWLLNEAGDEPTQRALAEHAGIDTMMTSQVVRRLEAAELVTRARSERDARALIVDLTPKGRTTLAAALADVQEYNDGFFGQLGEAEPAFREALQTLEGGADGLWRTAPEIEPG